jgi:hypothetical protein
MFDPKAMAAMQMHSEAASGNFPAGKFTPKKGSKKAPPKKGKKKGFVPFGKK